METTDQICRRRKAGRRYNKEMEKKKRKPKFCLNRWRFMNFRMRHAAASADKKKKKKRSGDDEVTRVSKRKKKKEIQNLGATGDNTAADTIIGGSTTTANIKRMRENIERTEGCLELESLTKTWEPVVRSKSTLVHYKSKCFELSLELEKKKIECTKLQGELAEVVQTRKTTATEETERTPANATEYWRKMHSDLESRVLRIENGNSTMAECVESCISKLENVVPRMENENSKMGCLESRISKVESLVQRWVELHHSENIESEAPGLQNGVTGSGEKQRDENKRSTPNAETSSREGKDSCVCECKTKEKALNVYDVGVNKHHESESEFPKYSAMNISCGCLHLPSGAENLEEGKAWECSEDRPSQHGSSSQDHLEMSKVQKMSTIFSNLASDEDRGESLAESEDSDSSADDSTNSLHGIMDMFAMKYMNNNEDKSIKWKSEADMLSSFEADPELCMRAVCALHRQQTSEDKISEKGLFYLDDLLRCVSLANFLMDGDGKGDLKKSMKELEKFDCEGVEDCKRLAREYSVQLFREDCKRLQETASHED